MNIISDNSNNKSMQTGKAKGWLGEYYWVSLPLQEDVTYDHSNPMQWAYEKFGKAGARWYENQNKFFFKDEKDMTMFILRWSDGK